MNQTFAINKQWRNIVILVLLLLSIFSVIAFTKINKNNRIRQESLLSAINEKNCAYIFDDNAIAVEENTFIFFENGLLGAKNMDKTLDSVYTSLIDPYIVTCNGLAVIYENCSPKFYLYKDSLFFQREANTPISYLTISPSGRYAVLNDHDLQIFIYENDGTLISSFLSTLPLIDITMSENGKFVFLIKLSLSQSSTYWLESYRVETGKQVFSQPVTFKSVPTCSYFKTGWFIWNQTDAFYITPRKGKLKILNNTT